MKKLFLSFLLCLFLNGVSFGASFRSTFQGGPTAGGAGTDTTAIHDDTASEISAITNKATPVGGDFFIIEDSAAANVKKHVLLSALNTSALGNCATTELCYNNAGTMDGSVFTTDGTDITLASGQVLLPDGTNGAPVLSPASDEARGIWFTGSTGIVFSDAAFENLMIANGILRIASDGHFQFSNTSLDATAVADTGLVRDAAGVVRVTDGSTAAGKVLIGASTDAVSTNTQLEVTAVAGAAGQMTLSTAETTVVDGDVLGRINFQAPLEADGSDSILVGASIWAEADGTFSATVNDTDLVFAVGVSDVAVERMRISASGMTIASPASTLLIQRFDGSANFHSLSSITGNHVRLASAGSASNVILSANGTNLFTVKSTGATNFNGRSAAPTSPAAGDAYYDTDTNEFCVYNGSAWTGLIGAGTCI